MKKILEWINLRGRIYRFVMRLSHKYNWHYAPPVYPDGDMMLWCKWCGLREVVFRRKQSTDDIVDALAYSMKAHSVMKK